MLKIFLKFMGITHLQKQWLHFAMNYGRFKCVELNNENLAIPLVCNFQLKELAYFKKLFD